MRKLKSILEKNTDVKNYRIFYQRQKGLTFGINGKVLGGPYTPIRSEISTEGEVQVEWKNGEVSFGNISGARLEKPKEFVKTLQINSFKDKYAKNFVEPYKISQHTRQFSKYTKEIIEKKQDLLIINLKKLVNQEQSLNLKSHEADIWAQENENIVTNSKGLHLEQKITQIGISTNWENKLFFSIRSREPFDIESFKKQITFLGEFQKATTRPVPSALVRRSLPSTLELRRTSGEVGSLEPKVILSAYATWSLFAHFIIGNLSGSRVANDMSKFKRDDFEKKKKVLNEMFTIKVTPNKKLTPGASDFTSEGVEKVETDFVKDGKLLTPALDLKHAEKLNMPPAPMPSSPYITSYTKKDDSTSIKDYISKISEAIYVPYFLGLHTQNSTTGDYSLPVPYGIYIKDGKPIGSAKLMIIGNFFYEMKEKVKFVKEGLFPLPALCYSPQVVA